MMKPMHDFTGQSGLDNPTFLSYITPDILRRMHDFSESFFESKIGEKEAGKSMNRCRHNAVERCSGGVFP